MKKILSVAFFLLLIPASFLPQQAGVDHVDFDPHPVPLPPSGASLRVFGNLGTATCTYWVDAVFKGTNPIQGETAPVGPVATSQCPNLLGSVNFVRIQWQPVSGAQSYNVFKTATAPNTGNILLGNSTGNFLDDTGQALAAWTKPSGGYPAAVVRLAAKDGILVLPPASASYLQVDNLITNSTSSGVQNGLLSGGNVYYTGTGYNYIVTAATYTINGTTYSSPQTSITLAASDPTNPRIDVVYVNTSGAVGVLTGTPGANPAEPQIDPISQLFIGFIYVAANSTSPTGTSTLNIYVNNAGPPAEWTCTGSAGWNCAGSTFPFPGVVDLEFNQTLNYNATLSTATPVNLSSFQYLAFGMESTIKQGTGGSKKFSLCMFWSGNGISQNGVCIVPGTFGWTGSANTREQILIPTSVFQASGPVTSITFQGVSDTGTPQLIALTNIQLQVNGSNSLSPDNKISGDILSSGKAYGTKGGFQNDYLNLPASGTVDVLPTVTGAGYIDTLWIGGNGCAWNCEVKVFVDGEATASIDVPLPAIMGGFYNVNGSSFVGRWTGASNTATSGVSGYLKLPIPFSSSIHVTMTNHNGASAYTVWSDTQYQIGITDTWPFTQKLKIAFACGGLTAPAAWVACGSTVAPNGVFTMLNVNPARRGRIAGVSIVEDSGIGTVAPATAALEGNVKMYLDGASSPSVEFSGFEDFFMMGDYFRGWGNTSTSAGDIVGSTVGLTGKSASFWQAYRFFIDDPVSFQGTGTEKLTVNCGDTTEVAFTGNCSFGSTVWYYTEK